MILPAVVALCSYFFWPEWWAVFSLAPAACSFVFWLAAAVSSSVFWALVTVLSYLFWQVVAVCSGVIWLAAYSKIILPAVQAVWSNFILPVVKMKAPGGTGGFISRKAFEACPAVYFYLQRSFGAGLAGLVFAGLIPDSMIRAMCFLYKYWGESAE